jgi:hypothetical protein
MLLCGYGNAFPQACGSSEPYLSAKEKRGWVEHEEDVEYEVEIQGTHVEKRCDYSPILD